MKKALLLFLCFTGLTTTSCNLDDGGANFHFVPLQIVDAELPESFKLNETYQVKVTYVAPNGCTTFEGFDISESDTEDYAVRNVVAIGSALEQQQCSQVAREIETTFSFVCLYTKTYMFRFWTGEDENGESLFYEVEVPVIP